MAAARFRLSDAQLVVAREYGVESWPRLMALIDFLRADYAARLALFLEAAVGESPRRARDLPAHAPELARASLQTACAAADAEVALAALERDPAAARRSDGPLGAPPLWTLCGSKRGRRRGARGERARSDREASAARGGRRRGARAVLEQLAPVRLLLEAGADPNGRSGPIFHHMPLHHAALRGWGPPAVDLLLEFGAELEVRDPGDRTPYQVARRHGHVETAEHLLVRGADGTLSAATGS